MVATRFLRNIGAAAVLVAFPLQAQAEVVNCAMKVDWTAVDPAGQVLVSFTKHGVAVLCDVNGPAQTSRGAISPEVCKSWLAGLMTARARQSDVLLWWDYPGAAPQCSGISYGWEKPNPYPYFMAFN